MGVLVSRPVGLFSVGSCGFEFRRGAIFLYACAFDLELAEGEIVRRTPLTVCLLLIAR